jgi:short-subunit dehydrogenase
VDLQHVFWEKGRVNVVFLGATRGMGRALARRMSKRGDALYLLGRDLDDLERTALDLEAEGRAPRGVSRCDLADPSTFGPALDALERDPELCRRVLDVDFTATVLFCEEARRRLLARGGGTLCVFSSVAGERGRKPVVLYGAAKAGLTRYLEGLDHRYRAEGLRVVTVKPGFVKTGLTAGLEPPPFAGEPDEVAEIVVRAIDRGTPVVYAPRAWGAVMTIVRNLPRFVMRRVGF